MCSSCGGVGRGGGRCEGEKCEQFRDVRYGEIYDGDMVEVETSVTAHGNPQSQSNGHCAFTMESWDGPG